MKRPWFWKRPQLAQRCIKTCCDMMEQTWTNQTNLFIYIYNLFIYIYIIYLYIYIISYLLVETHIQAVLDSFRWDCVPFIASHSSGLAKFCTDCPYWWPAFVSISFCVMLGTALEGCFQMPLWFIDVSLRYSSNIWWDSFLNPNVFPKKGPHKFWSTKIDHLGPTII